MLFCLQLTILRKMKVQNQLPQQLQVIQQKEIQNLDLQTESTNIKLIQGRSIKQKLKNYNRY